MNAHVAKDGLTFLMPIQSRETPKRRRGAGVGTKVSAAVRWFADMGRRRAVLDELGALSDHELADIGLNRGDLPRVFDPAYAQARCKARHAGF